MSEPDATQILSGPSLIYVAPLGTTLPIIDAHGEIPVTWPAGWLAVGYTDAGVDETYTPTMVPIRVDELASDVSDILSKEEYSISAALSEATLLNLSRAISASIYTTDAVGGIQKLAIGSKPLTYTMVGLQGSAPGTNLARLVFVQKAIASKGVAMKHTRTKNTTIPISFMARQLSGQDLVDIYDITSTGS